MTRDLLQDMFKIMMDDKINNIDGRKINVIFNKHPNLPSYETYPIYHEMIVNVSKLSDEYYSNSTSDKRGDLLILINIDDIEAIKTDQTASFIIAPSDNEGKWQDYKVTIEYEDKIYSIKDEQTTGFETQKSLTIGFDS